MGIFSRRRPDTDTEPEPGAPSQPEGDGPVRLGDRVEPSGQGSPDTNQGKAEPLPPDHPEPLGAPELSSMNVSAGDPQGPRHDAVADAPPAAPPPAPQGLTGPGSTPDEQRPVIDTGTSTGRSGGPLRPVERTSGTSHRAPGLQGTAPEGEAFTTVGAAAAAQMAVPARERTEAQGDTGPAPAAGDGPAPGSSEQQPPAEGTLLPPD